MLFIQYNPLRQSPFILSSPLYQLVSISRIILHQLMYPSRPRPYPLQTTWLLKGQNSRLKQQIMWLFKLSLWFIEPYPLQIILPLEPSHQHILQPAQTFLQISFLFPRKTFFPLEVSQWLCPQSSLQPMNQVSSNIMCL